eukprot:463656-Rhodomonas_salina.2
MHAHTPRDPHTAKQTETQRHKDTRTQGQKDSKPAREREGERVKAGSAGTSREMKAETREGRPALHNCSMSSCPRQRAPTPSTSRDVGQTSIEAGQTSSDGGQISRDVGQTSRGVGQTSSDVGQTSTRTSRRALDAGQASGARRQGKARRAWHASARGAHPPSEAAPQHARPPRFEPPSARHAHQCSAEGAVPDHAHDLVRELLSVQEALRCLEAAFAVSAPHRPWLSPSLIPCSIPCLCTSW